MVYTCQYQSPMGDILLAADEIGLTGLWFVGQKYFANILPDEHIVRETPILAEAKRWLAVYFSGSVKNKEDQSENYGTEGMCLGMCFGTAIGTALGNNIAIGLPLGMLLGMVIGSSIKKEEKSDEQTE